ncbi:hypothetical protein Tco_0296908, partial [Tanacetum coccineum]
MRGYSPPSWHGAQALQRMGCHQQTPILRKDHDASRPTQSTLRGKSLASIGLEAGSTFSAPASQETPAD